MSDNAKRRLSIDLDEIERQLRQTGGDPRAGALHGQAPAPKADPLAELARIVGQDDPFGALLDQDAARAGARQAPSAPQPPARRADVEDPRAAYAAQGFSVDDPRDPGRADPRHGDPRYDDRAQHQGYDQGYDPEYDEAYEEAYDDAGAWDDPHGAHGAAHDDAADWAGGAYDDEIDEEEPRRRGAGRKSMVTAGALIVVAAIGVGTALWFAGSVDQAPSDPPLIAAESEPARVAPADPGGVEIPNQDTALLGADSGEARVVDREEQPVDIAGLGGQAVGEAPRVVLPQPGAAPGQVPAAEDPIAQALGQDGVAGLDAGLQPPLVSSPAVAALGEPRRVRTVTVRPDGTIVAPTGLQPATPPAGEAPLQVPAQQDIAALAPLEPIGQPAADDLPAPAADDLPSADLPAADAPAPIIAAPPLPPPAPPRESLPVATQPARPAAPSGPLQLSAVPQTPAPAAQPAAPTGGFAVQLAIRGSEESARAAFAQLQGQYSGIIGDGQPIIRQAVVNGSTIYRVRVGPYSRERATQACDQIKAAQGDCFVAANQ
ncbi:SPOR domain-containing protein [Salinarimonas rosea]|uniref:SPOR domain-containing protein n=1 Tax=Salinarimonas rosea TaxID=552063 RepID=UPI0004137135|nr:SPOR domain-containing protein [Salinarimonas rosea]